MDSTPRTPRRVAITGAGRDLGRALAIRFAETGAEVFLSSRDGKAAERVCTEIRSCGFERVHAYPCDLGKAASIRAFAAELGRTVGSVDVLINNGAAWLDGIDIEAATDEEITDVISSGATGTVLMVKHFLPLLRASSQPDIVTIVSSAALPNTDDSTGHVAFYAAKGAQGRLAETLSTRLRPAGIRVITLYPPTFDNVDPLSAEDCERGADDRLTSQSIIDCVLFAVNQPRDCFIRKFEFESV
jgi:NAD(P)-dependent dehydrogenase (short-subunit alcohol dehydrogenase family)